MSVQFGECHFDDVPVEANDLDRVRPLLTPYGPDGEGVFLKSNVGILYRAFHTTKESHGETQPLQSDRGSVLTWDGRLDNREELVKELGGLNNTSHDLEIVAAAWDRWSTAALGKLIGDWALSVWDPRDRSLVLAKDFVGTRHLYYTFENNSVTWSTILDPLVLIASRRLSLEEEYIAGWLAFLPAPQLTPYVGIHSVPPSCFVRLWKGREEVSKYWDFDPAKKIRYRSDSEYEEHFRKVFAEAVGRRLRADRPILAELSGGMDSSSIVCMADKVIAEGGASCPRLDTVSYFSEAEPNWNEKPYFTAVEKMRGRTGCHIDVGSETASSLVETQFGFAFSPGSAGSSRRSTAVEELHARLATQGNRVILSGTGGDEAMGGVPTPLPELEDLLAALQFKTFTHQLMAWALKQRRPWLRLLLETIKEFCPPGVVGGSTHNSPIPWLQREFVKRNQVALRGYARRVRFFGARPSFQQNLSTLGGLRRQFASCVPSSELLLEKRHPYLDRSLLEFVFAVPREQLLRPGERRSLMRRALAGMVPCEVLNRRRKAFVARQPLEAVVSDWSQLMEHSSEMLSTSLGLVEQSVFAETLVRAGRGQGIHIVTVQRTLAIESWLRQLRHLAGGFVIDPEAATPALNFPPSGGWTTGRRQAGC